MICNYSIYKKKEKEKKQQQTLLFSGIIHCRRILIDIPFSLVYNLPTTAKYSATVNKKSNAIKQDYNQWKR